jgi:hypothetical protein
MTFNGRFQKTADDVAYLIEDYFRRRKWYLIEDFRRPRHLMEVFRRRM